MAEKWLPPIDEASSTVLRRAVEDATSLKDLGIAPLRYLRLFAECSSCGPVNEVREEILWGQGDGMVICPGAIHVLSSVKRKLLPFAYSPCERPRD